MRNFFRSIKMIAAVAALGSVVLTGTAQNAGAQAPGQQPAGQQAAGQQQATGPKVKDNIEYDLYNNVIKDLAAPQKDWKKTVADLDTWKQKYPDSEFKDYRQVFYVQAYQGAGQFGKALDAAGELLNKDLDATFNDPKSGPQTVLQLLYAATTSVQQAFAANQDLTPDELATGEKAAKSLLNYNKVPPGTDAAQWEAAKKQLQAAAKATLMAIAIRPGDLAMVKKDCDTAASAYEKALGDYPDSSFISYKLGSALGCIARNHPDKSTDVYPKAIYEFVRAAVIDPSLGGSQPKPQETTAYAEKAYATFHGSDEGLQQLKEQAKASPLPPNGFTIKSSAQEAAEKEEAFKTKYPEIALWLGIKRQLADPATGMQYFEGSMKNAAVPELKGTVVEGKPACRSKELLVAVPMPDAPAGTTTNPEITLKLDTPLTGKPEPGEIRFQGVPTAFSQNPFMLTMEVQDTKANIKDLKVAACAAPARRGGARKGTTARKK